MFELERFLSDCCDAVRQDPSHRAARELAARCVANPMEVLRELGEPRRAGVTPLYQSEKLTVLNVVWGPLMQVPAHNHDMWAVIAVYAGREDNIFWRRVETESGTTIEAAGAKSLGVTDAVPLGRDIIHSVVNPADRLTGAIHLYGGDFFEAERLEWDPETHCEQPFDFDRTRGYFERSNALDQVTNS
jgi:predicted metal-dependent enzyme (double-stranded beta helix superfamily)